MSAKRFTVKAHCPDCGKDYEIKVRDPDLAGDYLRAICMKCFTSDPIPSEGVIRKQRSQWEKGSR